MIFVLSNLKMYKLLHTQYACDFEKPPCIIMPHFIDLVLYITKNVPKLLGTTLKI